MPADTEHQPIVGDDGELLTDDPTIDPEIYDDYVQGNFPTPPIQERIGTSITRFTSLSIIGLFGAAFILSCVLCSSIGNNPFVSRPVAVPREATARQPSPTKAPTNVPLPTAVPRGLPPKSYTMTLYTMPDVVSVNWSPDGKYIAFQGGSYDVVLWRVSDKTFSKTKFEYPSIFDWSNDSLYLVINNRPTAANDPLETRLLMIDHTLLTQPISIPQTPFINVGLSRQLVISADNQLALLSPDGHTISIIANTSEQKLFNQRMDDDIQDLDWISDSGWLSIINREGLWRLLPNSPRLHPVLTGTYQNVSWSPDGTQFAITQATLQDGIQQALVVVFNAGHSHWEWRKYIELDTKSYQDSNPFTVQVAWSPSGNRIATFVQLDTAVDVWDATSGAQLDRLTLNNDIFNVDWSPDGEYLAIANLAGIIIWSPE